ncbi:Protein nud1 [Ascochyta rabiei]|uniref:Protein nud1 n=1 Tax=Didymella rabiei TaxID=5454 RepID=UPI001900E600|nr:Protein nud1 [Ascochyta rabiei]UPX10893.1 Protein nud1 [Ascochyta rabiei]
MADISQPWLDDLSEEWVPQQPTPPADSPADSPMPAPSPAAHSAPPKPRSRLPRLRHSSGSFSDIQPRSNLRPTKQRNALAERSHSDSNVVSPAASRNVSHADPARHAAQSFTTDSQGSLLYGTVAISSAKANGHYETPEWKRRLVKGEGGEQKDLFGPSGLENIFAKPAGSPSEAAAAPPKRKLGMLRGLSAMPSSPPPWPAAANDSELQQSVSHSESQLHRRQDSQQAPSIADPDESLSAALQEPARTVSGQIEFENEQFSPVFINTELEIGQTPDPVLAFRGSELANRLRQIGSPPPDQHDSIPEESSLNYTREDSSFARIQDDSLPEGLPAGTPDIADVGRFVQLRRGGYSQEGSFRRRPLSPSPERAPTAQGTARSNFSAQTAIRDAQPAASDSAIADDEDSPKTPHRRANHFLSPDRAKSSGSPLKLFGAHDTFTSNRLIRRLSQLEYKPDSTTSSSVQDSKMEAARPVQNKSRLTSVEEVSVVHSGLSQLPEAQLPSPRRVSAFGQGQLNKYQFDADYSVLSSDVSDAQDDSAPEDSPTSDVAPPGSRPPFKFQLDESPTRGSSRTTRQSSRHVSNPFRVASRSGPQFKRHVAPPKVEEELDEHQDYADGKRGPTSPFKNPTPKRRRTINSTFEESEVVDPHSETGPPATQDSHAAIQAVLAQKHYDNDHGAPVHAADPDILARRHILRPRNPTPSQRRREEIEAEIMEATEAFMQASPKLNTIREQLEPSMVSDDSEEQDRATAVANEVAMFTMKRQAMRNQSRKRSVTTQDFLDEALKIMNFIRTKGRPTSGLGDLEETDAEFNIPEGASEQPSTSLTFERPPSREGHRSAWRDPNKRDSDPSVITHLRKYEEKESDTFLNSSLNSVKISRMKSTVPEEINMVVEKDDIRITDHRSRPFAPDDSEYDPSGARPQTGQSAGSSLGHTIATNVSRRSDQVATLAPEAVAHLIPHQIAGMSFNREKKIWVRQKSPSKEHRRPEEDHSSMNQSEEDPFGNIPDLSVSETRDNTAQMESPSYPQPTAETLLDDDEAGDEARPMTCASSVPSKASNNFGWSFTKTETRATSCSTQVPRRRSANKALPLPTTYAIPESDEDDIEHEIQYFEGRDAAMPNAPHARVRDITISFAERELGGIERRHTEPPHHLGQPQRGFSGVSQSSKPTWAHTNGTSTLPRTRPNQRPRFNGDGDLSILEELPSKNYRMELSMNVSAPVLGQGKQDTLFVAPSSPLKGDVTFMLSDLPDFTLNQIDEFEHPDRVVVKHDGTRLSKTLEDRYAQGTAELVKALQDVEPDEPYWEDLREIALRDRDLGSLHRLDELCYRLEELDVSNNQISQVEGIPYAMRRLKAQNNCLNGLTSWATLGNLQHLDVSNNDIDSLDGLAELVHLRVLRIDNNKLKTLDSILHLDGLIELHAGGNDIDLVDFARSNLKSLTDLDLHKNRLLEIRNVHRLSQLQHLNLDDNELDEFPLSDTPTEPCKHLRSIRICRNGMTLLDVDRHFPRLESLYVDGNSLTHVSGLEHLRRLRTFSAREQILGTDLDAETCVSNLVRNTDVHNLYISLNSAYTLGITQHLMNLQRLELASMGLKELPDNFGQLTPNIRSVNLNFNSLRDLRPLLNIKRLSELLLVGNKLERLRQNAMVLGKFSSLSKLDWRDNPVTLRFYASTSENRIMSLRQNPDDEQLTDRFVLPRGDIEADEQHQSRLDYETRIRRRVTEMMLANLCRDLRELDGLPFDKARVLVKDDVWERLTRLGVIRRKQPEKTNDDSY